MKNSDLALEKCWLLAQNSKSDMRFGSFIEKNGKILGQGWNRQSTPEERRNWRVDYCTHAEEAALFESLSKNHNLAGATLYVAGFLKSDEPFLRPRPYFTCKRCATRVLINYNLPVMVRTKRCWEKLSSQEALQSSLKFFKKGFWHKVAKRR